MVYSFINQKDKSIFNSFKSNISFKCKFVEKNQDINSLIFDTLGEYILGFSGNVTFLTNVSLFDFVDKDNCVSNSVIEEKNIIKLLEKTKTQITYLIEEKVILEDEKLRNLLKEGKYKYIIIKGNNSEEKLNFLLSHFKKYLKNG